MTLVIITEYTTTSNPWNAQCMMEVIIAIEYGEMHRSYGPLNALHGVAEGGGHREGPILLESTRASDHPAG